MRSEVAVLNRNIIIKGSEAGNWPCTLINTQYIDYFDGSKVRSGSGTLSNI